MKGEYIHGDYPLFDFVRDVKYRVKRRAGKWLRYLVVMLVCVVPKGVWGLEERDRIVERAVPNRLPVGFGYLVLGSALLGALIVLLLFLCFLKRRK